MEFIRRFLQHVLPRGFHKVRYYGLLSPHHRHVLRNVRQSLASEQTQVPEERSQETPSPEPVPLPCRQCLIGSLVIIAHLPRRWRSPP
jgi:hypothetical protein